MRMLIQFCAEGDGASILAACFSLDLKTELGCGVNDDLTHDIA